MTAVQTDTFHSSPVQMATLAENPKLDFVPSVKNDLSLLKISPELESAILGLRRKLTLKKFLTMKLSEPMFTPGSVQAIARIEMMKLPGLNGTRAEASQALLAMIKKSKLYGRLGYWGTFRCYFSVFDIYKALLAAQVRNDKIIRDFKNPKRKQKRERDPVRLAEAKIVRLERWATEERALAAMYRDQANKLLAKAKALVTKAASKEEAIELLEAEVQRARL